MRRREAEADLECRRELELQAGHRREAAAADMAGAERREARAQAQAREARAPRPAVRRFRRPASRAQVWDQRRWEAAAMVRQAQAARHDGGGTRGTNNSGRLARPRTRFQNGSNTTYKVGS